MGHSGYFRRIAKTPRWCYISKVSRLQVQQAHDFATYLRTSSIPSYTFQVTCAVS